MGVHSMNMQSEETKFKIVFLFSVIVLFFWRRGGSHDLKNAGGCVLFFFLFNWKQN